MDFQCVICFELADDSDLEKKPDALFIYGVPGNVIDGLAEYSTVFYDDEENGIFVGAIPDRPEFGYFGYLKKMILTLHNSIVMKSGHMPFHGAMVKILLQGNKEATILMMGDTGAGKSETLEAFRVLAEKYIRELTIIADDMGSIELDSKGILSDMVQRSELSSVLTICSQVCFWTSRPFNYYESKSGKCKYCLSGNQI